MNKSNDDNIFIKLINKIGRHPQFKDILMMISGIIMLVTALVLISFKYHYLELSVVELRIAYGITLVVTVLDFLLVFSSCFEFLHKVGINEKLLKIEEKREEIENKIKNNNGNVLDVIKLNLNHLDEYYTIDKYHNKLSYNVTTFMIAAGFICILITIVIFFVKPDKYIIATVTGFAGIIAEYIGATSLILYKESTKHIDEFIERLTYLQKVMLAVELADKLPHKKRNTQIELIITGLITINNKNIEDLKMKKSGH